MSKLRTKIQKPSEDISTHPSSDDHKITYDVVCQERYRKSIKNYENQFKKELFFLEQMQNKALEGVKVHRGFTQSVLDRKIPKRGNMKDLCKMNLNPKDEKRLKHILNDA